jgi:hypothetical protein
VAQFLKKVTICTPREGQKWAVVAKSLQIVDGIIGELIKK